MAEQSTKALGAPHSGKLRVAELIGAHWKALTIAMVAVLGVTLTDILEPWPIKIVVDQLVQSKKLPDWLHGFVSRTFGQDQFAILNFAVAAVAAIASWGPSVRS